MGAALTKNDDRKVIPIRPGIRIESKTDHLDVVRQMLGSASPEQNSESTMSAVMAKIDGLMERLEALETYVYGAFKKNHMRLHQCT